MLVKRFSAPAGVFFLKKSNIKILIKNYSTITDFIFDRNYDFEIFTKKGNHLTFLGRLKEFFKRNPYEYDPFDEEMYPELSERINVYRPDELMFAYYLEYWESWNTNLHYFDLLDEKTHFLNFNERAIVHYPVQAEYLTAHYPFEMYAEPGDHSNFTSRFDSVMTDPYTNEELTMPLTTLRWNYYIVNFVEESDFSRKFSSVYTTSGKLLNDLEENNDLISSILETIHEPKYRNTIEYKEFFDFAKLRLDLSFLFFVESNIQLSLSLMVIPWFFCFLVGDLLTHEFVHTKIILYDLQTIFLYIFFGHELVWQFEENFKQFASKIFTGVKYSVYRRQYKTEYTTFKKDILKVWRLINLKTAEPKLYSKLKQYLILVIKKKLDLSITILRATAVREKQSFRINLFNTASILRFFIWCYRRLLVIIPNYYNNFKNFLINLIPNIFIFLKKYFINLYLHFISYINYIYKYFKK